jgi:hypothetical protein
MSERSRARTQLPRAVRRRLLTSALIFLVIVLGLGAPRATSAGAFTLAYQALGNAMLSQVSFGRSGRALLAPGTPAPGPASDPSWNTGVVFFLEGSPERQVVMINPRRVAFLPLLFLLAAVAASWLEWRQKLLCFSLGLALSVLGCLAWLYLFVWCGFASMPGLVYDYSEAQRAFASFVYEAVLAAPLTRWLAPGLLATLLIAWRASRSTAQARRARARAPGSAARAPRQ